MRGVGWQRLMGQVAVVLPLAALLSGLVLAIHSFFWLPLWISTFCVDTCQPPHPVTTITAWEFSLRGFLNWPISPGGDTLVLIVLYFPLLAGSAILLEGLVYLAHPTRTLLRWLAGTWIAGVVVLLALLLLIFILIALPDTGYWGMGASYALWGIGLLLLHAGRPELRRAQ